MRSMAFALYRLCLVFKLLGVTLYAGGLASAFVASAKAERSFAVHRLTTAGVVLIWVAGYLLTLQLKVGLTEMWILGGLIASVASKLALVRSATRDRPTKRDLVASTLPFVTAIVLMVFRPTWAMLKP